MLKNFFLIIYILCLSIFNTKAQLPYNIVDSIGFKQGMWLEYKVEPTRIELNGGLMKDPSDSTILLNYDIKTFGNPCLVIRSEGFYIDGLKAGLWKEYFTSGTIKSEINYKKGIPWGKCKIYWGNGNLRFDCNIGDSIKTDINSYDNDGNFVSMDRHLKSKIIKYIYCE